ncbi:MAG: hypothetical protein FWE56_01995 [Candidatus Bathyarchaeota archaeon]|nr:hypothetical protein [Candidatus Termiticorpusculum sp.]MCL2868387.1 hypothetical protein [Candidatus Termiticorpusculum sp.]
MNANQKQILKKMIDKDIIGARHILHENLKHYIEKHKQGNFNNDTKELLKQGYITRHTTKHGRSYTIPPRKVAEIKKLLSL